MTEVEVVPTGLSENDFGGDEAEISAIRRRYGGDSRLLMCTVSRLEREKNLTFVLEGMRRLKDSGAPPFRLLVIGDGSAAAELAARAAGLGLDDEVRFCGRVPHADMRNYYRACGLFVFASESETQGIVLLEAMAACLPVVALKASGVSDTVKHGEHGLLADKDLGQWTAYIGQLLEDPALRHSLGEAARAEAEQYRSVKVAEAAERCYRKAIAADREVLAYQGNG